MRLLRRIFLKGLLAVLPVGITVALLVWMVRGLEGLFRHVVLLVLPEPATYRPGMGIALGLVAIFAIGLVLQMWMLDRLWHAAERLLARIPLVRTLLTSVTDLMGFFNGAGANGQVVALEVSPGMRVIGLLTRESFEGLPADLAGPGMVAVYLPLSYQIGGHTVIVPRDRVTPLAMSVEDALRFCVTAGMTAKPVVPT